MKSLSYDEVTPEVKKMVKPWLTGNDEQDAQMLKRTFPMLRFSIGDWRVVVQVSKPNN